MHRFISSAASSRERPAAASSSSSSAEQPAISLRSVEKPGFHLDSIRDVQRWLAEEHIASCTGADIQRIREAVAVLSRPKPRQEDVQPLQRKWQVAQQQEDKKRRLTEAATKIIRQC